MLGGLGGTRSRVLLQIGFWTHWPPVQSHFQTQAALASPENTAIPTVINRAARCVDRTNGVFMDVSLSEIPRKQITSRIWAL